MRTALPVLWKSLSADLEHCLWDLLGATPETTSMLTPYSIQGYPLTDIAETTDAVYVTLAIPGYTKEQLDITYRDGRLCILGNYAANTHGSVQSFRRGIKRSSFTRTFKLATDAFNVDKITSTLVNGELHITIPKQTENSDNLKIKKISID